MFEVGKKYRIHTVEDGGTGYHSVTVLEWNAPLLKVSHPATGYEIINTSSQLFHKAEPMEKR